MIRDWEVRSAEGAPRNGPSAGTLIKQAFSTMTIPVAVRTDAKG